MSFLGGFEHGQGSLGILYTDRSVVRHLHGLDRSPDLCTFYHIHSLVDSVRAYDHEVWTGKIGGSPPACHVASSPPQTLQSCHGHPHPINPQEGFWEG